MSQQWWNSWEEGDTVCPEEFVATAARLLEVAVQVTSAAGGGAPRTVREHLVDGLAESLSTDGPSAVVRLDARAVHSGARADLRDSAQRLNGLLLELVESSAARAMDTVVGEPQLAFESHCVGYIWTPAVAALLAGGTGTRVARDHYNEWLWQLVTLRDALLPFVQPERIRVAVDGLGLRRVEQARDRLILDLVTRRASFLSIVAHVASVLGVAGPVPGAAYGVRTASALVLPAFLARRELEASPWLFDLAPETLAGSVGFIVAGGVESSASVLTSSRPVGEVEVVAIEGELLADREQLVLEVGFDDNRWRVDGGAVVTGHRYALRPAQASGEFVVGDEVSGCEILREPGSVRPSAGLRVVPTHGQWPLVAGILGRLSPGNAVLWSGQDVSALSASTDNSGDGLVLIDVRTHGGR